MFRPLNPNDPQAPPYSDFPQSILGIRRFSALQHAHAINRSGDRLIAHLDALDPSELDDELGECELGYYRWLSLKGGSELEKILTEEIYHNIAKRVSAKGEDVTLGFFHHACLAHIITSNTEATLCTTHQPSGLYTRHPLMDQMPSVPLFARIMLKASWSAMRRIRFELATIQSTQYSADGLLHRDIADLMEVGEVPDIDGNYLCWPAVYPQVCAGRPWGRAVVERSVDSTLLVSYSEFMRDWRRSMSVDRAAAKDRLHAFKQYGYIGGHEFDTFGVSVYEAFWNGKTDGTIKELDRLHSELSASHDADTKVLSAAQADGNAQSWGATTLQDHMPGHVIFEASVCCQVLTTHIKPLGCVASMLATDISAHELVPDNPNQPSRREVVMLLETLRYIASLSDGGIFKGTTVERYALEVLGDALNMDVVTEASKRNSLGKRKLKIHSQKSHLHSHPHNRCTGLGAQSQCGSKSGLCSSPLAHSHPPHSCFHSHWSLAHSQLHSHPATATESCSQAHSHPHS